VVSNLEARASRKRARTAADAASDAAPDAQAGASDAARLARVSGRRTGRTGRRAADAPVVGVDVTPYCAARVLGAADAGVRPMDHRLTRPMRFQPAGSSLEPHRTQAIYCVTPDVSVRCVRPELWQSTVAGSGRCTGRTGGASGATLTCAVK
jgi:hypothetical protein